MFGHNSNTDDQAAAVQHGSDTPGNSAPGNFEPETIAPTTVTPDNTDNGNNGDISAFQPTDLPATAPQVVTPPTEPAFGAPMTPAPASPPPVTDTVDTPVEGIEGVPPTIASPVDNPAPVDTNANANGSSLLELKQSALHELSPLLGHLEQSPEEKFRTTMMMIQASDDHTMLQAAYDAARAITDEKVRAQALLDVVNEINYFTQANGSSSTAEA